MNARMDDTLLQVDDLKVHFPRAGKGLFGSPEVVKAVGVEGKVYLNIPAGGTGKINLKFQNHLLSRNQHQRLNCIDLLGFTKFSKMAMLYLIRKL